MGERQARHLLILLLVLAAGLRLAFVLQFDPVALYWDEVHYHEAANRYAAAWQWRWSGAAAGPTLTEAFRSSLVRAEAYAAAVGSLYAAFGTGPRSIFVLQALLDAGTCLALFGLARALAGFGVGLVTLILAALYEPSFFAAARLQTETLASFLYVTGLWAICSGGSRSAARHFLGGVLLAVATLTRPAFQFLFPLLLPVVAICRWDRPRRQWMIATLAFALGFFVLIGPRLVLTASLVGRPLWSSTLDPSSDMYAGAVTRNAGWKTDRMNFAFPPRDELLDVLGNDPARRPSPADFRRATWRTWWHHPLESAAVMLHKLYEAWARPYNDSRQSFLLRTARVERWHQVLVILGIVGIPVALRNWRTGFPMLATLGYLGLTYLGVHIELRYAFPLMPLLICLGGVALGALGAGCWQAWRNVRFWWLMRLSGLAVAGFAALQILSVGRLLEWVPHLTPEMAHSMRTGAAVLVMVLVAYVLVKVVVGRQPSSNGLALSSVPGAVTVALLALVILVFVAGRPLAESWRQWPCPLSAGRGVARHEFILPADRGMPQHAEFKLDLLPDRLNGYDLVVRINGEEIKRYRDGLKRSDAAFPDEGDYRTMFAVQRQQLRPARAWYVVPVAGVALEPGSRLRVEVAVETENEDEDMRAGAVTLFGDYAVRESVYDGPSPLSPRLQADNSLYRYMAVGDFRMRRRISLAGSGRSSFHDGRDWGEHDLSPAPGLQRGRYRMLLVVTYSDGQVVL